MYLIKSRCDFRKAINPLHTYLTTCRSAKAVTAKAFFCCNPLCNCLLPAMYISIPSKVVEKVHISPSLTDWINV